MKQPLIRGGLAAAAVLAGALVMGVAGAPAQEAAETPCGCWYRGYEDGLEFDWNNRQFAEQHDFCAGKGLVGQYDAGFRASVDGAERQCPY